MSPELILTVIGAYKETKKIIYNGSDRPPATVANLHLVIVIAMGHFLYIIGQYFLLSSDGPFIVSLDVLFVIALLSTIVNDVQDLVYKKKPLLLYLVIVAEFILWATLTLVALMSARLGEGILLFMSCISRIADLFLYYIATIDAKRD